MIELHRQYASFALVLLLLTSAAVAHHAPTEFNFDKLVEIEGTVVEVKWHNPHVSLKVQEDDGRANPKIWVIEGSSVSMMLRTNAAGIRPQVQEKVRVAGHPSRRPSNRLYGANLLLASGQELVFDPEGRPRWTGATVGTKGVWFDGPAPVANTGIFRVWSTKFDEPWLGSIPRGSLTRAAKEKLSNWDAVTDSVATGCKPVGPPMIMGNPYPFEFVRHEDRIVLRIELYDAERVIHMNPSITRASLPAGIFGRSTGKWDGETLVVTTDGITWPFLDYSGVPMSPKASLVERFTPTADGKRLNYTVVVTDPVYLTEPVKLERSWVARPNESVKRFNCKE